jgi:Flp pilus assembly protein TadB
MLFALGSINPDYMKIIYTDPLGPRVLIIAAILQIVGAFFLWRIIDIEV